MTVMPLPENDAVEPVLKKDRVVILTALCSMFVAAWAYLMTGAGLGHSPIDLTVMHSQFAAVLMKPAPWSLTGAMTGSHVAITGQTKTGAPEIRIAREMS